MTIVCTILTAAVFTASAVQESETSTTVGLEIVVNYVDGSQSEPYKQSSQFSLIQMYTLIDMSDKEIENFAVRLLANLKTSGTVTSWQIIGSIQTEVYKTPETVPKTSATYEFDKSGTTWISGEEKELRSFTLQWSQVEAALIEFGAGDWSIQFNGYTSINVDFDDGTIDTADAEAHISMVFEYVDSGISDYSLTVENDVSTYNLINTCENVGLPGYTLHVLFPVLAIGCLCATIYSRKEE